MLLGMTVFAYPHRVISLVSEELAPVAAVRDMAAYASETASFAPRVSSPLQWMSFTAAYARDRMGAFGNLLVTFKTESVQLEFLQMSISGCMGAVTFQTETCCHWWMYILLHKITFTMAFKTEVWNLLMQ